MPSEPPPGSPSSECTPPQSTPRRAFDGLFTAIRDLGVSRNTDDRWVGGVCSGIANRLGIDPILVRGILIVLLFVGGIGGLIYLIAWALMPDRNGRILAEAGLRGDGGGIVLLVVIGIVIVSNAVDTWWLLAILVPVGLVVWWGFRSARLGKTPEQMSEEATRFVGRATASFSRPTPTSSVEGEATGLPYASASTTTPVTTAPDSPTTPVTSPAPSPHGMGPGRTGSVAAPERVVHRPRTRGGFLALLLTAGLAVAAYGIGLQVATSRGLSGTPELVAVGFAVAGAGLALLVVGLVGRRAGFTTFLVTVLALAAMAGTSLPTLPSGGFGERRWAAASQPATGFSMTAGEAQLTLANAGAGSQVRVAMGFGQLTITVPKGMTATVTPSLKAGQVVVNRVGAEKEVRDGVGPVADPPIVVGSGPTPVSVRVDIVAGEVVINEES